MIRIKENKKNPQVTWMSFFDRCRRAVTFAIEIGKAGVVIVAQYRYYLGL